MSHPQGRHASADEIAASAYQAVALDDKYDGAPVQVRVVMGKEPKHFMSMFKGKLLIFEVGLGFSWMGFIRCMYFIFSGFLLLLSVSNILS